MTAPRCRWCGKPIAKHSTTIWVREESTVQHHGTLYLGKGNRLRSVAECQTHTNHKVISVRYSNELDDSGNVIDRYVWSFNVWDGDYVDKFFCNGEHARRMGYAAAEKGWSTKSWRERETA